MDKKQTQKAEKWLESKLKSHTCPKCGTDNWGIGEIVAGNVLTDKGVTMGGTTYPMLLVVCDNCAYTEEYAAVKMGLVS